MVKSNREGPIFVVAYNVIENEIRMAGHVCLSKSGAYELLLPGGKYYLAAFQDTNANGRWDSTEAWAQFGAPDLVDAETHNFVGDLNMALTSNRDTAPNHIEEFIIDKNEIIERAVAGEIADLNDIVTLDAHHKQGYWEPFSFLKEVGANIWFVEPYDPGKIPVLFIHGAGGKVSSWDFFFKNIDRSRYQPWFFYYPSGLPLQYNAYFLAFKLYELHAKYRFEKMAIIAHSMGGLVGRSFLIDFAEYFPFIKLFISISTPWGGVDTARMGVKGAPVVVPAWKDVAADSDFITSLYQRRLPAHIRYYLLFGYHGNRNPLSPNNDGTIDMKSMLDERAQQEAIRIYGLNENHAGILNSLDTTALLNDIAGREMVKTAGQTDSDKAGQNALGSVSVRMIIEEGEYNETITNAILVLEPLDRKSDEEVIFLDPFLKDQVVDSVPVGDYLASLIIPAYDINPRRKPIHIKAGKTVQIQFESATEGILTNVILPSGNLNHPLEIESIRLEGPGVRRLLLPDDFKFKSVYDASLSHKDFIYEEVFCFFGLPEGDYRITVNAVGYRPYTASYRVNPGLYGNIPYIQLVPDQKE